MNWLEIMAELPVGWTLEFERSTEGIQIAVTGWFPHVPKTKGEERFCRKYIGVRTIMADELDLKMGDLFHRETRRLIQEVTERISQMRAERQGGDA